VLGQAKRADAGASLVSQHFEVHSPLEAALVMPEHIGLEQGSYVLADSPRLDFFVDLGQRQLHVNLKHPFEHISRLCESGPVLERGCRHVDEYDSLNSPLNLGRVVSLGELHQGQPSHRVAHQTQLLLRLQQPIAQ